MPTFARSYTSTVTRAISATRSFTDGATFSAARIDEIVEAHDARGLIIVPSILNGAPSPPITSSENRLPATCAHQPPTPSNGRLGPSTPSRARHAQTHR